MEPQIMNNKPTTDERDEEVKKRFPQHKNISKITVEGDAEGEEVVCYLKEIDLPVHEQALGKIMKTKGDSEYLRAGEIILLKCWLEGDDIIKTDQRYLKAASMQAYDLMEMKSTTIKKI